MMRMDAKRAVEIAQAESEAARDEPIPEGIFGERRRLYRGESGRVAWLKRFLRRVRR